MEGIKLLKGQLEFGATLLTYLIFVLYGIVLIINLGVVAGIMLISQLLNLE